MKSNKTQFARVMAGASAVVLSSALAVPAVAIAADVDDAAQLVELSEDGDQKKADEVTKLINELPAIPDFDNEGFAAAVTAVEDARKAYEGLTTSQKKLVEAGTIHALEGKEGRVNDQKIAAADADAAATLEAGVKSAILGMAVDSISDLPAAAQVQLGDAASIRAAEQYAKAVEDLEDSKYALTNEQKGKLADVVAALDKLAADTGSAIKAANEAVDTALQGINVEAIRKGTATSAEVEAAKKALETAQAEAAKVEQAADMLDTINQNLLPQAEYLVSYFESNFEDVEASYEKYNKELTQAKQALQDAKATWEAEDDSDQKYAKKAAYDAAIEAYALSEKICKEFEALKDVAAKQLDRAKAILAMAEEDHLFPALYGEDLSLPLARFMYIENSSLDKIDDLADAFDPVNSLIANIKALPATQDLTRADLPAIKKAEERRDALTSAQLDELEKTDPDILDVLKADRARVNELIKAKEDGLPVEKAEKVIMGIANLPELDDLTPADAPYVAGIRKDYDALDDHTAEGKKTQKLVANADALFAAEARLKELSRKSMARLYNPNSGEHFYTADPAEKENLVGLGWQDEGTGWIAPATSNTPVYRLYNGNAGEHHYTTSAEERDALVEAGWTDEGIGWYSVDNGGVAVYREYNPNELANNHNYTADKTEHDKLVELGWKDEGIAWYGLEEIN